MHKPSRKKTVLSYNEIIVLWYECKRTALLHNDVQMCSHQLNSCAVRMCVHISVMEAEIPFLISSNFRDKHII